ncbi:MAG: hypothetical protein ACYDAE_10435 [Steroidobacteraceae bacterium]
MRPHQRARFPRVVRRLLPAILALVASGGAIAQTPLAMTVHTVTALTQPPAVEHNFTVTNAGSVSVTLTDLGSKLTSPLTPAPLASVAMAVTQGASVMGTPVTAPGTPITFTATSNTTYTIHVVGLPGTNVGSGPIEEDVNDSSGNRIYSSIDTLSAPSQQPSQVGLLADKLTVQNGGSYTVALNDLQFPAALQAAALLLIDTTTGNAVAQVTSGSPQTATLNTTDSYQLIAYGVEGSAQQGGLFGVAVTPATGAAIYNKLVTVGAVTLLQTSVSGTPASSFTLGASGATLQLTDLSFPTVPLTSVGAALVDAATQTVPASVTTTGAQNLNAPSTTDGYEVYAYAVPDSTAKWGSYSVSVQQGTAFPFLEAQAVSAAGSGIQAFTFDTAIAAAGSYAFTLTDFKFPAALAANGAALGAAQNGRLIGSLNAAGNFSASPSQGIVTLLVFGESGSSPGLMGIDLSPAGGGAAVFDVTEGIGTGFSSTSFTATSAQSVQADVADLSFPAALANLDLAVTSGTKLIGQISSAGSSGNFPFTTTANTNYNVNVLAQPATPTNSQQAAAGTYAMSVDAAPTVTLTASATSVTSGGTVNLTWSATNATSCTASASPSNSAWSGSETPSASGGPLTTSAISATTTFSLSCTGGGGTASATATVNVAAQPSSGGGHGGGGAFDPELLLALALILALRISGATAGRFAASPARSDPP